MDKMLIAVRRGTRHRNVAKMSLATEVRLMKYLYIIDTAARPQSNVVPLCQTSSYLVRRRQTGSRPVSQAVS